MMESKITILIIDDKNTNIYALQNLLDKPDRKFLTATNGKEGLAMALNNDVDLIILDVQMPEMDGFEVAQILKSNKRTKEIPIIFASAEKKEQQSVMKGFEEGAVDYLSKPLDPEITKAKVSVLLKIQIQKKELIEKNQSLQDADKQIKQLNAELQRNVTQLEATNKELESFSYSVSHDLRAPLRALDGYSQMLEEDYISKLDDNAKRLLGTVQQNIRKMDRLIEDLLKFSRLGKKDVQKTEVNVGQLVHNVIHDINDSNNSKTEIIVNALQNTPADYVLITQVWTNLISNAIKYSSKKEKPKIDIGSQPSNGEVIYYVKDNGVGFDMQYADKLFGVFQRLHKASEFEGTGVGLAIVQRILIKHGGRVWAESEVNKGTTFYFSLPVQ
jgi:two-component system sensor histidine kinase/response regulator